MKLSIFYDGQFYIGLVEIQSNNRLQAFRYIFGNEPKDQDVLDFIYNDLQGLIEMHEQNGISIKKSCRKKINPKRMQRQISKELQQRSISTKAQEALKADYEQRKKANQKRSKQAKEDELFHKRACRIQKAKDKHKGR